MSNSSRGQDGEDTEFAYREPNDNIEVEAKLYEKLREPDEKKWHFKKIANLALTSDDNNEKRGLKEILRKAGVAKMKPSEKHNEEK